MQYGTSETKKKKGKEISRDRYVVTQPPHDGCARRPSGDVCVKFSRLLATTTPQAAEDHARSSGKRDILVFSQVSVL
jgi:hypothetical protein